MTLSKSHYTLTLQGLSHLFPQTGGLFFGALTADSHKNTIFLNAHRRGMLLCLLTFDNPGGSVCGTAELFPEVLLVVLSGADKQNVKPTLSV